MLKHRLFRKKSISAILTDANLGLHADGEGHALKRTLKARDLTALGIAAIVGAGIFSTIGNAAYNGGPGIPLYIYGHVLFQPFAMPSSLPCCRYRGVPIPMLMFLSANL